MGYMRDTHRWRAWRLDLNAPGNAVLGNKPRHLGMEASVKPALTSRAINVRA
jgi:hypothetical protein